MQARATKALVVIAALLPACGSRTGVLLDLPTDASAPDVSEVPDAYEAPDVSVPPPPFDAGPDAPSCNGAVAVGEVPPNHRPVAAACSPSGNPYGPDAGPVACAADAGCPTLEGAYADPQCVGGLCVLTDECFTDADCHCPAGVACACMCSSMQVYPGVPVQPNVCVAANCFVDSDCGPGKYCEMSPLTYCGRGGSYGLYCSTAGDRCVDPAKDCTLCKGQSCVYAPQVGWWVCAEAYAGGCLG